MKLCVWISIDEVTTRYHDSGAVLIVAESAERAKELVPCVENDENYNAVQKKRELPLPDPDHVWDVTGEEIVMVFPNAGCC